MALHRNMARISQEVIRREFLKDRVFCIRRSDLNGLEAIFFNNLVGSRIHEPEKFQTRHQKHGLAQFVADIVTEFSLKTRRNPIDVVEKLAVRDLCRHVLENVFVIPTCLAFAKARYQKGVAARFAPNRFGSDLQTHLPEGLFGCAPFMLGFKSKNTDGPIGA